ncbi:MAG: SoxR reducing system RseC family protein [Clostridia bacterium]|nr:SoxR reducing system RseC family protein [Clostridia bacterium]
MEQKVLVRQVLPDGNAQVVRVRESACSGDCHKCSGCGAAKETITFTALDPIGVKPGDVVYVKSDTGPVLRGAAVLYVLPLALFLAGYLLTMSGWGGCAGFVLVIALVVAYVRLVANKEQILFTITGYSQKKGDNDLG